MTRTLYVYILRDLAKITAMALVALTGIMTIFGVVEPLRKQGLSGTQVLALFSLTVPVMVSLTLPIAALFGATFVYGRFEQNNEMLAAKASGISPLSLLRPAMVLGVVVTMLSLVLSNYVAPVLAARGERFIKANVEGFIYEQLRTKNYVKMGSYVIHAARIDPAKKTVIGVVAGDLKDSRDVRLIIAPAAFLHFDNEHGENWATIRLQDAAVARTSGYDLYLVGDMSLPPQLVPSLVREKPSWYDWGQLVATLKEPARNSGIRRILEQIRRQAYAEQLSRSVLAAIKSGRSYRFTDTQGEYDYVLSAERVGLRSSSSVVLSSNVKVVVSSCRSNKVRKTVMSHRALIVTYWSTWAKAMEVTLQLTENVTVVVGDMTPMEESPRRSEWTASSLRMPPEVIAQTESATIDEIGRDAGEHAGRYTGNKGLIKNLKRGIARLRGRIKAEMHGRIAYSLSCCLMVAMGAALGLIFRGGQVLTAFAISVLPAATVVVMVAMGQELVVNPGVDAGVGFAAIWGGPGLLLLGNAFLYLKLMRR